MKKSYEEFYRNKSDRELYGIYTGKISASLNDRELAQRILKERDFDFNNVQKYSDKWELERLINSVKDDTFPLGADPFSPAVLLLNGIICIIISIVLILSSLFGSEIATGDSNLNLFLIVLLPLMLFVAGVGLIAYSRKRRRIINAKKLRFDSLTRKILDN